MKKSVAPPPLDHPKICSPQLFHSPPFCRLVENVENWRRPLRELADVVGFSNIQISTSVLDFFTSDRVGNNCAFDLTNGDSNTVKNSSSVISRIRGRDEHFYTVVLRAADIWSTPYQVWCYFMNILVWLPNESWESHKRISQIILDRISYYWFVGLVT